MLQKAIPSFINDIKHLIVNDKTKLDIVRNVLEKWLKSLGSDMTINGVEEDPMMEVFLHLWISQIYLIENRL